MRRGLLPLGIVFALGLGCRRIPPSPFAGVRQPDIVLVTIDTLRWDAPGFAGGTRAATPNLDRLAAQGWVFPDAHAHNVVTLPSHVNILTGLYPYQHGVRENAGFRLAPSIPTIATILKERKYATGAFIGAFPLDSRFGLARGFDVYDQRYPEGAHEYDFVISERPATEVISAARAWFGSKTTRPRFLWVHLYDCHAPYQPPPPFDRQYADAPYYGEVAAVDAALAPLLADIESDDRPALLVVTADHGEALGDHGERTHGLFAYEATLRIPLVLWSPRFLRHRVERKLVRHVDIAPTILEAAGIPQPAGWPGRSLFAARSDRDDTSYFESLTASLTRGWAPLRGVIRGDRKYIELPVPELYDLRKDPGENHNLAGREPDVVGRLKDALPAGPSRPEAGRISSEQLTRLRNLGYLGSSSAAKERYGPEDDPKNLVALDSRIHEVVSLYQGGRIAEAAAAAADVVRVRPTMVTGYEFLSFLQAQEGDDAAAIRTLEEARRRNLLNESLLTRLALLYNEIGRPEAGIALLEPLASTSDPDVWNALGIVRAGAGRTNEAIAAFRRALSVDPNNAIAWQNIGLTEVNRGRDGDALAAFDHSLAINDRLPRAWSGKGVALEHSGREEEAIDAWKKAVSIDAGLRDAWFNLGVVAFGRHDEDLARRALSEFVQRSSAARGGPDLDRARALLKRMVGGGKSGVD